YDEAGSHLCFVKAPKVKASTMPYVFYDTETYTDEEKQHHVHLVTAVTCCETCSGRAFPRETCRLCNGLHSAANCLTGRDLGEEFSNCVSHSDCACQMADFVAVGPASLNAFFAWLSTTFPRRRHCYDSFLLLGALLNGLAKKRPQVLFQGSRLMSMTVVHALAYWTEKRTGLFSDYVSTFLKLKAESSGSPGMSDEDKAAYIADFFAKEGVTLDKVEPNPGLRFVAKIFLNSYEDWLARLTDPNLKVKACEPIGSEFMLLEYRHRYFNQRPFRVVYRHSEGQWEPPHGTSLGMWTDEVPAGSRMTDFVSGGPKLYTYIVEDAAGVRSQVLKCKGIRLTPEIRERSDELRSALLHGGSLQLPQLQFRRDKASCTIHTVSMDKTFQRVLTKRVYGACSRPYGYK
uniref:Polyprotein n=1 Tax=Macrostomum lignano TaxID=282301 RepID=A0A1I8GWH3_9PLAT